MPIRLTTKNVQLDEKFLKDLNKLDKKIRADIDQKFKAILEGSIPADIKKLQKYPHAHYRLKIGNYRLLFTYNHDADIAIFLRCRNRKDLY